MFLKLLSWLLYGAAILPALVFVLTVTGAAKIANTNREQKQDLLKVAEVVETFRQKHSHLPSKGEFHELTSDLSKHVPWQYELLTTQPSSEQGFRLSKWQANEATFAIRYWSGEWDEFYDSKSRRTTLDDTSEASFWIKDSLFFGWIALGFAFSGWLTARVRKTSRAGGSKEISLG